MKIRYTVTMDDVIAFNRRQLDNSFTMKYGKIILPCFVLLIFTYTAIVEQSSRDFIEGIILAPVFFFGFIMLSRLTVKRFVRKLHSQEKGGGIICEHTLELTDTDIIERTDVGEQRSRISSLYRIETSPDYGFIYINGSQAHVVPRNNVLEGDFEAFFQVARERFDQA